MKSRQPNDDPQKQTESLAEQAWLALESGRFEESERLYLEATTIARTSGEPSLVAICLSNLGHARILAGKSELAQRDLEESISIASANSLSRVDAHTRLMLAEQKLVKGESDLAIEQLLRSLEAALKGEDAHAAEEAAGILGRVYLEKGWAEQASEWFRQALEFDHHGSGAAAWLGSLGLAMAELGEFEEARNYYSLALARATEAGDMVTQATCKGSLGNLHFENMRYKIALSCYEEALSLSLQAADSIRVGIWLGNIGNTWLKLGDLTKSVDFCKQGLKVARDHNDLHSTAAHLDSLGDCLMKTGDIESAKAAYDEALEISEQIKDKQGERIYLSNVGRAHQSLGQMQPAFEHFRKAIDLFDYQRSAIKSDDLKTSFAGRGQDLYRDMVKVCISLGKRVEALEYVGRAKSRALLDLLSNSPIDISEIVADSDADLNVLVRRERNLRDQIAHLERLFWKGNSGGSGDNGGGSSGGGGSDDDHRTRGAASSQEDTQQIYREWRDVVKQLKVYHPNYASLISASSLTFGELGDLWSTTGTTRGTGTTGISSITDSTASNPLTASPLKQNTAILELYLTDQYLLCAGICSGFKQPTISYIDDENALMNLSNDLASFLEMSSTEGWEVPQSICTRLYRALIAPIIAEMPDTIDRLLIIPHNSLHHLPFAALHDGKSYLCERFAISYLPTSSLIPIMAKQRTPDQDRNYLISAISDYSATREKGLVFSSRLRSAAGLEDLSYTMEEAETIFALSAKTSVNTKLVKNDEVKNSLPSLFKQFPIVHFAGHAVFNPDEPLASGLVLGDGSILTAASILQGNALKTNCGRLLVLSACQTGVNMVTAGGEILGLARALMYAGMPNLVLSLWEVADRSTAQLMLDFHEALMDPQASELDVAISLQKAQVKAISEGLPLHAWAPFIHMGID
jgi:CHAT domain-containing protein/tetratricopeptide (TPR) repeat protein